MQKSPIILIAAVASVLAGVADVSGFGVETHSRLSVRAANLCPRLAASLQQHPQEFPEGLSQELGGRTVDQLVGDGSVDEDSPFWRTRHHFHDPTRTWDAAGLTWGPGGMSSILWQQYASQGLLGIGDYAWGDAREDYRRALTDGTKASRDAQWAKTFRTLGHLIHLIQDAGAPSHTRDDDHLPGDDDAFHTRADDAGEATINAINQADLVLLDPAILMQPANLLSPLPIARFIDATDGARPLPDWGTNVGIAEYSNGKFFSDDRLFGSYAHPAASSLEDCDQSCDPGTQTCTGYLCFRAGQGETDYKVARASALTTYLVPGSQPAEPPLDNAVLDDYGRKLFPRAIGYSVGLIDYFFRTSVNADGSPVLRLTATDLGSGSGNLAVQNTSSENMTGGTIQIWYDRRSDGDRVSAGSVPADIEAGQTVVIGEGQGIDFTGLLAQGPTSGSVVVVYQGTIGAEPNPEPNAVAERTCSCPSAPASPTDPAGDCEGLCPCRYLEFAQGNPGVPGDGLTVTGDGLNSAYTYSVRLDPPMTDAGSLPEGMTITVFPTTGVTLGAISVSYAATDSSCYPGFCNGNANAEGYWTEGQTSVNDVTGYFTSFPMSQWGCCSRTMDDLAYVGACNNSMCIGNVATFDAVAYCPGPGAFP